MHDNFYKSDINLLQSESNFIMQWFFNMIHTVVYAVCTITYSESLPICHRSLLNTQKKKKNIEENTQGNMKLMFTSLYFKHKIYTNPKLIKYINQKNKPHHFPCFCSYHVKGLCLLLHKNCVWFTFEVKDFIMFFYLRCVVPYVWWWPKRGLTKYIVYIVAY